MTGFFFFFFSFSHTDPSGLCLSGPAQGPVQQTQSSAVICSRQPSLEQHVELQHINGGMQVVTLDFLFLSKN